MSPAPFVADDTATYIIVAFMVFMLLSNDIEKAIEKIIKNLFK